MKNVYIANSGNDVVFMGDRELIYPMKIIQRPTPFIKRTEFWMVEWNDCVDNKTKLDKDLGFH